MEVYTYPSPVVKFEPSPDTIMGGQYVGFANMTNNATSFFWNFGDGSTGIDSAEYHQYGAPGTYFVYLIGNNGKGCIDTAWDTVYVLEGITVPNVFTPNGDGQNDVFHVKAGGLKTYFIEIFNR